MPEMDNPSIPCQCGGAWEGLLTLPVMLWIIVWAGRELLLPDMPTSGIQRSSRLLYSLSWRQDLSVSD